MVSSRRRPPNRTHVVVAVADLNLHSYEEFEAEAKDMTADSTVSEIEASGGAPLGIEVDVRDHEAVEAMVGSGRPGMGSSRRAGRECRRRSWSSHGRQG